MASEQSEFVRSGSTAGAASGSAGAGGGTEDASSSQIRADIARTRAEMDQTVDRLSERLQPRHLLDDVLDMVRSRFTGAGGSGGGSGGGAGESLGAAGQSIKDAGANLVSKFKDHPMPALLIGAGLAWMLFEGDEKSPSASKSGRYRSARDYRRDPEPRMYSGSYVDARTGQPYGDSYGQEWRGARPGVLGDAPVGGSSMATGAGGDEGPGILDKAKEKLGDMKDAVTGAVGSAAQSVKDAASGAADKASDLTGRAREGTQRFGDYAGESARSFGGQMRPGFDYGRDALRTTMDDYPLAVGAAALAAGVIAGLLLPGTRRENELMGETASDLKDAAKSAGSDLLERGKQVASATASAAAGEAEGQGLHPGSLGEKVGRFVSSVKDAAADAAQREGLHPGQLGEQVKHVAERVRDTAKEETRHQAEDMKR